MNSPTTTVVGEFCVHGNAGYENNDDSEFIRVYLELLKDSLEPILCEILKESAVFAEQFAQYKACYAFPEENYKNIRRFERTGGYLLTTFLCACQSK